MDEDLGVERPPHLRQNLRFIGRCHGNTCRVTRVRLVSRAEQERPLPRERKAHPRPVDRDRQGGMPPGGALSTRCTPLLRVTDVPADGSRAA